MCSHISKEGNLHGYCFFNTLNSLHDQIPTGIAVKAPISQTRSKTERHCITFDVSMSCSSAEGVSLPQCEAVRYLMKLLSSLEPLCSIFTFMLFDAQLHRDKYAKYLFYFKIHTCIYSVLFPLHMQ